MYRVGSLGDKGIGRSRGFPQGTVKLRGSKGLGTDVKDSVSCFT